MIRIEGDDGSLMILNDSAGKALDMAFDKSMHYENVVILVKGREWKCIPQEDMKEVLKAILEQ